MEKNILSENAIETEVYEESGDNAEECAMNSTEELQPPESIVFKEEPIDPEEEEEDEQEYEEELEQPDSMVFKDEPIEPEEEEEEEQEPEEDVTTFLKMIWRCLRDLGRVSRCRQLQCHSQLDSPPWEKYKLWKAKIAVNTPGELQCWRRMWTTML